MRDFVGGLGRIAFVWLVCAAFVWVGCASWNKYSKATATALSDCSADAINAWQDATKAIHAGGNAFNDILTAVVSGARVAYCLEQAIVQHLDETHQCADGSNVCAVAAKNEGLRAKVLITAARAQLK